MAEKITLRIILENPPPGIDFGIQNGHGVKYATIQLQRSTKEDLKFEFMIDFKDRSEGSIDFSGKIVQGPINDRFIYIDIGTYAGVKDSIWGRRLKIPLAGITREMALHCVAGKDSVLETVVPGTAKDKGPNCGTVKPFKGWVVNTK